MPNLESLLNVYVFKKKLYKNTKQVDESVFNTIAFLGFSCRIYNYILI